jgi:hypothetical protein
LLSFLLSLSRPQSFKIFETLQYIDFKVLKILIKNLCKKFAGFVKFCDIRH